MDPGIVALALMIAAGSPRVEPAPCDPWPSPTTPECRKWIAWRHAPIVYQNVKDDRRDYITRFDFDRDWDPTNQIEHVKDPAFGLPAEVYYEVVEGPAHFFILYTLYHPQDYDRLPFVDNWHENDLEGLVLTLEKTARGPGSPLVMETLAHNQIYQYYADERVLDRASFAEGLEYEDRDQAFRLEDDGRPAVIVEAKGHGVYSYGHKERRQERYVRYLPAALGSPGELPGTGTDVRYGLIEASGDGLWTRRRDAALYEDAYAQWTGKDRAPSAQALLQGVRGARFLGLGHASPPWAWDDFDDASPVQKGDWLLAPAFSLAHHLCVPGLEDPSAINDPGYYRGARLLEEGAGNPRFEKGARRPCRDQARPPGRAEGKRERLHYFGAAELQRGTSTVRAEMVKVAPRSDARGSFLSLSRGSGLRPGAIAAVGLRELWLPLERFNSILLRYANPAGVPAARIYYVLGWGDEPKTPYRVTTDSRLILLPSLTAVRPAIPEALRFDSTKETLVDFPAGEPPWPHLMAFTVEFTNDLRELGVADDRAAVASDTLPALVREQMRAFRELEAKASIDVLAVEVLTRETP